MSLFPRICTRSMAISRSSGSLHIHRQSRRNISGGRTSRRRLTRKHSARLSTLAMILNTHEEYLCTLAHKEIFYVHKGTLVTHCRFILAPCTPSKQNFRSFGTSVVLCCVVLCCVVLCCVVLCCVVLCCVVSCCVVLCGSVEACTKSHIPHPLRQNWGYC